MNRNLKVLMWDDSRSQSEIIEEELRGDIPCSLVKADSQESFLGELDRSKPNVIIAGRSLTGNDQKLLKKIALEKNPDIIFIFITSQLGSELAIELISKGGYEFRITGEENSFVEAFRKA